MKEFTTKQKSILAKPGYYIEYYGAEKANPFEDYVLIDLIHIGNSKCTYHKAWNKDLPSSKYSSKIEFQPLIWNHAPTKQTIAQLETISKMKEITRYLYFPTYEKFEAYIKSSSDLIPQKAPSDIDLTPPTLSI